MKKALRKLLTVVLGLSVGAIIYFGLWEVFVYFGIIIKE
tara:strand:- start:431 stop:547 length:117 start_codon:yes stop_codon:yes gene_type:complete